MCGVHKAPRAAVEALKKLRNAGDRAKRAPTEEMTRAEHKRLEPVPDSDGKSVRCKSCKCTLAKQSVVAHFTKYKQHARENLTAKTVSAWLSARDGGRLKNVKGGAIDKDSHTAFERAHAAHAGPDPTDLRAAIEEQTEAIVNARAFVPRHDTACARLVGFVLMDMMLVSNLQKKSSRQTQNGGALVGLAATRQSWTSSLFANIC